MKRRSLHIGLNRLDPQRWNGWDGALGGCVSDATAMRDIAEQKGFEAELVLDEHATVEAIHRHLKAAAADLREGDFFFLTYAGHGGQVPDTNGDEPDGYDETWCLYDGQLVDDSLFGAFCTFAPGVRIFVMSDSCHSGSVTRDPEVVARDEQRAQKAKILGPNARQAPLERTVAEFRGHSDAYAAQQRWWPVQENPADSAAMVVLISGCKDDQTSSDGPEHGAFTQGFLDVWGDGDYRHNYNRLCADIDEAIGLENQTPQVFAYGKNVAQMISQIPLSDEEA
jgi:hypothetical protein